MGLHDIVIRNYLAAYLSRNLSVISSRFCQRINVVKDFNLQFSEFKLGCLQVITKHIWMADVVPRKLGTLRG
jgi:hypothetical protein